ILALTIYLYKSKKFKFFSLLSIVFIFLRFNPKLASLTNGLSYPQYRWMYVLYLFIALAIGIGLQYIYENLNQMKLRRSLLVSILLTGTIYFLIYFVYSKDQIEFSFQRTLPILVLIQLI